MTQQSIKRNTIFNAIKTVSLMLFPMITFPYISRVLLPENVGKINFGASIVSYFSLIANLGIQTYAIRECSAIRDDKGKLSNTASQIYSINIVTTTVAYVALAFTLIFYRKLENYRVLIIIQSLTIVASTFGADWINSAMEDFRYITIRSVLFQFTSLVLMFVFVHQPEDYLKYAIISILSSAGANIVNIWYRRKYCKVRFIADIKSGIDWKRHMLPIFFLFVMALAQTIFNSVDSTMLGFMHGDREVGIYAAAHKMSNVITQFVASLLWVIMPRMAYYFAEEDYGQINRLLRKVLGFNALFGLPCAVGAFMLADEMVHIISGSEFAEAASVLRILMIGFIFTLFGGSFLGNSILLPSKKEKNFMIVCCIAAVVNIITNYMFIPKYGAVAAAGTTALCALIIFIVLLFTIDKKIRIKGIHQLMISPMLGCIGIVIICLIGKTISSIWIRTIVCGIVIICLIGKTISSIWIRTIVCVGLSACAYLAISFFGRNELLIEFMDGIKRKFLGR